MEKTLTNIDNLIEIEARWSVVNHLFHVHGFDVDYETILSNQSRLFLRPGDWVLDVGAHSGRHTRVFLDAIGPDGRILAIEPLKFFADNLKEELTGHPNATVMNCALSNYCGDADFIAALGTPEESGLRQKGYNYPELANPEKIRVKVRRIDDIALDWDRLDYVKIDIEGAELDCLEGAEETISRHRPLISFECGYLSYTAYSKSAGDFLDWANAHGYEIVDLLGHHLADTKRWSAVVDRARTWDFFYVPSERLAEFQEIICIKPMHEIDHV